MIMKMWSSTFIESCLNKSAMGRDFQLYFKRNNPLTKVCEFYFDVPVGEPFCRFNTTNYLEIAVNMGKASSLFNLKLDDTIQIDFT